MTLAMLETAERKIKLDAARRAVAEHPLVAAAIELLGAELKRRARSPRPRPEPGKNLTGHLSCSSAWRSKPPCYAGSSCGQRWSTQMRTGYFEEVHAQTTLVVDDQVDERDVLREITSFWTPLRSRFQIADVHRDSRHSR